MQATECPLAGTTKDENGEGVFRLESDSGLLPVGELVRFEENASGEVICIKIGEHSSRRLGDDER